MERPETEFRGTPRDPPPRADVHNREYAQVTAETCRLEKECDQVLGTVL